MKIYLNQQFTDPNIQSESQLDSLPILRNTLCYISGGKNDQKHNNKYPLKSRPKK